MSIEDGWASPFGQTYASKISSLITVFLLQSTSSGPKSVLFHIAQVKEDMTSLFLKFPKSLSFTFANGSSQFYSSIYKDNSLTQTHSLI